jgi:hypothetical protein
MKENYLMEKLDFKLQTTLRYQSEEQNEPDAHSAIDMYHLSLPFSCTHYIHVIRNTYVSHVKFVYLYILSSGSNKIFIGMPIIPIHYVQCCIYMI